MKFMDYFRILSNVGREESGATILQASSDPDIDFKQFVILCKAAEKVK